MASPGVGADYEFLIPALLALRWCANEEVEDFKIECNVKGLGKLDDLLVIIKIRDQKEEKFALQLKHKEKYSKLLQTAALEGDDGNYAVVKYLNAFKNIQNGGDYNYVLYTNIGFDCNNMGKMKKYQMEQVTWAWADYFNTGENNQEKYFQFESDNDSADKTFFDNFTLTVSQGNLKNVEEMIIGTFKTLYKSTEDVAVNYINIFKRWHQRRYCQKYLDKKMIIIHLFNLLLTPYIIKPNGNGPRTKQMELLEIALKQFPLTIMDISSKSVEDIWIFQNDVTTEELLSTAKQNNFLIRDVRDLDSDLKQKILWFFYSSPIFISTSDLELMSTILQFPNRCCFVLCGSGIDPHLFDNARIFQNLDDLSGDLHREIAENFEVALQGRTKTTIEEFDEISKFIKSGHLFQMLDCLNIGEIAEKLPELYVPRSIQTFYFSVDILDKLEDEVIVMANSKRVPQNFESKRNCHIFKLVNGNLQWISSKNVEALKTFRYSKFFIEESKIFDDFMNRINVICARPGMGKSVMINYLKNNCPSKFWTVKIELKANEPFFKKKPKCDKIINHFVKIDTNDDLENQIKAHFLKNGRICWFFDGLDELKDRKLIKIILNCIRGLSELNHRIWVSSRSNLQEFIEDELKVFVFDIKEFDEENQRSYITKRLETYYTAEEIRVIVQKIYGSCRIINNSEILGVPLQLFMITYIFIKDEDRELYQEFSDGIFILTRMYHYFFEGKFRHYQKDKMKSTAEFVDAFTLNLYFDQYKILALKSCFDQEVFLSFNIKSDKYVKDIKNNGDVLGVILKIENDTIIFDHNSFGEYFAAVWLSENFEEIPEKTFIFNDKYENIRLMFDMKLAEDSPGHLAVLYKDLVQLQESDLDDQDTGGRNVLHLASSYGTKYPPLDIDFCGNGYRIQNQYKMDEIKKDVKHAAILGYLSNCDDLLVEDELFKWHPWQYGDVSLSLESLETNAKLGYCDQINSYNVAMVIYYSVRFGFINLLKLFIENEIFPKMLNLKNRNIFGREETLLHVAAENGHLEIVKILIEEGADITILDENQLIPLHRAAYDGHTAVVEFLKESGSDIESVDMDGQTSLHLATLMGHFETVKFLVNSGANFEVKDNNGRTPLQLAKQENFDEIVDYLITKQNS